MLGNQAQASTAVALLVPGSKADTTAATGDWVAVADYEGFLAITSYIGAVTSGSIAGKIQTATDSTGGGSADVTGATFTTVTTSNDPKIEKIVVPCNAVGPYIRYLGTVTTGPVDAAVVFHATKKYAT